MGSGQPRQKERGPRPPKCELLARCRNWPSARVAESRGSPEPRAQRMQPCLRARLSSGPRPRPTAQGTGCSGRAVTIQSPIGGARLPPPGLPRPDQGGPGGRGAPDSGRPLGGPPRAGLSLILGVSQGWGHPPAGRLCSGPLPALTGRAPGALGGRGEGSGDQVLSLSSEREVRWAQRGEQRCFWPRGAPSGAHCPP